MALQAVLFDMDGVIVDTEPLHKKAYYQVFEDLKIDVTPELYESFTGFSTRKVCTTLKNHFDLPQEVDELSAQKRSYFKHYFDNDTEFDLLPGVRELFESYRQADITLILASSAAMNTINWVLEKFEIESYFKAKVSGDELAESKPNPEIFNIAAQLSGKDKSECMVIEDSTNGILAAHRAEIFCAAYQSFHSKGQNYELANIVVDDLRKLKPDLLETYFK